MALKKPKLTAFIAPMGLYKWKLLPMGLASAPGTFQNLMQLLFSGPSYEVALLFLNDFFVFWNTFEEHLQLLQRVSERIEKSGFKMKGSEGKFLILLEKTSFRGHVVSEKEVEVNQEKAAAIGRMKSPGKWEELQAVLGAGLSWIL